MSVTLHFPNGMAGMLAAAVLAAIFIGLESRAW